MMPTRRNFLKSITASTAAISFPLPLFAATVPLRKIRIGLIADVHKDIIYDADERLQVFIDAMNTEKVDAVLQMGDFCIPKPANQGFLDIFNRFNGPRHHVLGNHDTDGGFKSEQTMKFWGMEKRFYSFDLAGFHFIVLDANDRPAGWKGGYPHFIAADQTAWLREDLEKTKLNTFVFSHQSLERPECIDNQAEIREILEAARTAGGNPKVAGCFNGHWHIDHHRIINGIPYLHINSSSYYWLGDQYKHERLSPELAKRFPTVAFTAPYTKPLFTVLEIDPAAGRFSIRSGKSEWFGPSPREVGYPVTPGEEHFVSPTITAVSSAFQAV
jgi:calcineurin-like phosphoesterase family protein